MLEERTKTCPVCKEEKDLDDFYKKGRGIDNVCKKCRLAEKKEYYTNNKEKIKAKTSKYREENREKVLKRKLEYRKKNRQLLAEKQKEYVKNNPKEKERSVLRLRKWRKENSEKNREKQKEYRDKNLEKVRLWNHKRRALLAEATVEDFTDQELFDFWKENGINDKECYYCKKEMPERPETWDHYIAIDNGGPHERANLLPCCKSCNSRKHTKDPEVFMEELKNGL